MPTRTILRPCVHRRIADIHIRRIQELDQQIYDSNLLIAQGNQEYNSMKAQRDVCLVFTLIEGAVIALLLYFGTF